MSPDSPTFLIRLLYYSHCIILLYFKFYINKEASLCFKKYIISNQLSNSKTHKTPHKGFCCCLFIVFHYLALSHHIVFHYLVLSHHLVFTRRLVSFLKKKIIKICFEYFLNLDNPISAYALCFRCQNKGLSVILLLHLVYKAYSRFILYLFLILLDIT